ncbi:MAG: hypothetical protein JW937_09895 [Candidatus Omnitrophica bacterium]|nr:hypothetical protein [Candidatus Omnitrophota bacterium]
MAKLKNSDYTIFALLYNIRAKSTAIEGEDLMILLEVEENPNCEAVDMRVFHDLEPARAISQVLLEQNPGQEQWFEVAGWTTDNTVCPALAQKVDDSGDGVAVLVHGGNAGLRLRPAGSDKEWDLNARDQWGAGFLLLDSPESLRWAN